MDPSAAAFLAMTTAVAERKAAAEERRKKFEAEKAQREKAQADDAQRAKVYTREDVDVPPDDEQEYAPIVDETYVPPPPETLVTASQRINERIFMERARSIAAASGVRVQTRTDLVKFMQRDLLSRKLDDTGRSVHHSHSQPHLQSHSHSQSHSQPHSQNNVQPSRVSSPLSSSRPPQIRPRSSYAAAPGSEEGDPAECEKDREKDRERVKESRLVKLSPRTIHVAHERGRSDEQSPRRESVRAGSESPSRSMSHSHNASPSRSMSHSHNASRKEPETRGARPDESLAKPQTRTSIAMAALKTKKARRAYVDGCLGTGLVLAKAPFAADGSFADSLSVKCQYGHLHSYKTEFVLEHNLPECHTCKCTDSIINELRYYLERITGYPFTLEGDKTLYSKNAKMHIYIVEPRVQPKLWRAGNSLHVNVPKTDQVVARLTGKLSRSTYSLPDRRKIRDLANSKSLSELVAEITHDAPPAPSGPPPVFYASPDIFGGGLTTPNISSIFD